ncbi:MAG: hypothetical protein V1706_09215 [Pseudomonadota bacterium]
MNHLIKPFKIIRKYKSIFFIWILYILIVGNLGSIFSIFFSETSSQETLMHLMTNGSFFLFSITLLAASLSDFFIEFITCKENIKFKTIKITATSLSVIIILFLAGFFTHQINISIKNKCESNIETQILFTAISVILAIYIFCVNHLYLDYDEYQDIEDKKIDDLDKRSKKVKDDGHGIAI